MHPQYGTVFPLHLQFWGSNLQLTSIEPCYEKTCLRGFRPDKTQTGLHSYRDKLESWNFGFSKYRYYTNWVANNKGADQTARMRRLSCTFVVRIWLKQVFLWHGSILEGDLATYKTPLKLWSLMIHYQSTQERKNFCAIYRYDRLIRVIVNRWELSWFFLFLVIACLILTYFQCFIQTVLWVTYTFLSDVPRTEKIIYWNTLKTQHLIECQFLPEGRIIPVFDNEMDKSDQLACFRYKNQNVLA